MAALPAPDGKTGWPWTNEAADIEPLVGLAWPRITIVTPSYNQGPFLEETLRSVLLQGYPNLEYFVMDGGSQDDSAAIIQKYAPWLSGWVSEPDSGQSHAIMKGFDRATGTILAWLNSDDLYEPGTLAAIGQHFLDHPATVLTYGDARHVDRDGVQRTDRPCARPYDRRWLLEQSNLIPQPSAFFTASAYRKSGGLDEGLHYTMDLDLWLRLGDLGPAEFLPRVLSRMRIYPEAKFQAGGRRMHAELSRVLQRYGGQGLHAAVRNQLARTQLSAAFAAIEQQQFDSAQAELAYLFENAPEWQGDTHRLARAIADYAWRLNLNEQVSATVFVQQVSAHLPPEAGPADRVKSQALGLLLEALAFHQFGRGQFAAARSYARQAMQQDRRQLRNRGLWSIIARSFVTRRAPIVPRRH
jgi:glycosyltransferase involved in cell wall biosynthesis